MHKALGLAVTVLLAAASLVALAPTAPAHAAGLAPSFTTVWQDNFGGGNGARPSQANWQYDTGQGVWGTGEIETMTNSTANVHQTSGGALAITALRDAKGNWTSGRIETRRSDFAAPANGVLRVEARLQMPAPTGAAGEGYWPAFWMMGEGLRQGGSWPTIGEWDVVEGINGQNKSYATVHCGVNPGGPCNEPSGVGGNLTCPGSPCAGNWHTYAIEFDRSSSPEQLRWYVDGTLYFAVNSSQTDPTVWNNTTHRGNFVILDLAVGGAFPDWGAGHTTPTAATQSGGTMLVDYVKVATSG